MGQCAGKFCPSFERRHRHKKNHTLFNDEDVWRYTDHKLLKEIEDPSDIATVEMTYRNSFPREDHKLGEAPATISVLAEDDSLGRFSRNQPKYHQTSRDPDGVSLSENAEVYDS